MFPKIIRDPYRNGWSGPEFPLTDGVYVKIDKRSAFRLMRNNNFKITVSTSRGYFFTDFSLPEKRLYAENWHEFCKFLSEFYYYNCEAQTGKNISYWFNLGKLSYGEELEIVKSYPLFGNANYSTIIKWYNNYSKKGE